MQKWYEWLEHMKKKGGEGKMEEMHQRKVEKMIKSAEGSAGLLHNITKPAMWRGGIQILKQEEEDARLLDRCEAKRKEWVKHWQCDEEIQNMGDLEKSSRMYKAKTGVGSDGFQPKVPLDLTKETRGEIVELLEKVEQSGDWPQQAFTTMFFLIPKNVTSERPIALMPTIIRWWDALRAPEVAKWQQKCRVEWDATDGRNGGAQRTVWENWMEMERFFGRAKEEDQGAVALVVDLAKAFERDSLLVVWAWATHFSFPRKILRVGYENLTSAEVAGFCR